VFSFEFIHSLGPLNVPFETYVSKVLFDSSYYPWRRVPLERDLHAFVPI
jgi:hypothetical protein